MFLNLIGSHKQETSHCHFKISVLTFLIGSKQVVSIIETELFIGFVMYWTKAQIESHPIGVSYYVIWIFAAHVLLMYWI